MRLTELGRALMDAATAGQTLPAYEWHDGAGNCPPRPATPEEQHQSDYERQANSILTRLRQGENVLSRGQGITAHRPVEDYQRERDTLRADLELALQYQQDVTRLPYWPRYVALCRFLKGGN